MKFPFLSRRQEAAPSPEACIRLTKADIPPRRFDESADDRARSGSRRSRSGRRYYSAGSTADYLSWNTTNVSADSALYFHLNVIKGRCRDLARNNDYCRNFLRLLESNVVGPNGFKLRASKKTGEALDKAFNAQLEGHWKKAGKMKNAPSSNRQMAKREISALWIRTLATDGEVFEIFHRGYSNRYRFSSQIVDSSLIDCNLNEKLPTGNRIKMGVELDEYGAPVAYWVLNHHPNDIQFSYDSKPKHTRYTTSEARLSFLQEFPGQTRSVSWFAPSAIRAQMLQKFEEAVVVASRGAAAKGGHYEVDKDFEGVMPGDEEEGDGPNTGDLVRRNVEPGEMELLPRGVTFKPYDPQFPPANLGEMTKVMLRGLAAGAGGSYHAVAQNLEDINYSSIRAGDLEQRGVWRALQAFVIDHHEDPYFSEWAVILRFNRDTPIDGRKLDACLENDEYRFIARGWDWVDPLKEVNAHEKAIALRLTTRSRVVAETSGEDFEELLDEAEHEEKMMKEKGLLPPPPAPAAPPKATGKEKDVDSDEEEEPEDEE